MDKRKPLVISVFIVLGLFFASSACNAFIGAGIDLNKQFGNTINFDLGKGISVGDSAFGLAGIDIGVTWGVNYDLDALAGYPYDYGGIGAVTQGDLGYTLGITVDATNGAGFDGSGWGVPLAEQGITTTHFAKQIAQEAQLNSAQVALPFSGI